MSKKVWLVIESGTTDDSYSWQYENEVYVVGIFSSKELAMKKAEEYEKYNYSYIENQGISTEDPYGDIKLIPINVDQLYKNGKKIVSFTEFNDFNEEE